MSQAEGAKLDAVQSLCERLEATAASQEPNVDLFYPLSDLTRELRAIIEYPVRRGSRDEIAMTELGLWSHRHVAAGVEREKMCAYLLSELILLWSEAGGTRTEFLELCRRGWAAMVVDDAPAESCGDTGCGACVGSPGASEGQA